MTQPYPWPYQGSGPFQPLSHQPLPRYRPLRKVAIVSIVLMGLTCVAAVIQSVLLWRSYDEVKRFVYGLLSEDELDRGIESVSGSGPLLDLVSYLLMGTGIAFLIWLWQARENLDFLHSPAAPRPVDPMRGLQRRSNGWVVGAWFCPVVQFWYPLQIVEDVARASEPPEQPGVARTGRMRTLLYGWWSAWIGFWVIVVGGGSLAVIGFIIWFVRLIQVTDNTDRPYADLYDMQDFMVRVALGVDIGFTVATVLLIVSAVGASLMMLQVSDWQHTRATPRPVQDVVRPLEPPQYAPRYPGQGFPTYGR
ncbi:DUF4328 domain-containing protein [Kribbella sp. NPDC054772]